MRRTRLWIAFVVSICFMLPHSAYAQVANAQLGGRISDSQGAVIPNAEVRIVSQTQGTEIQAKSSRTGDFFAPALLPGLYRVVVQAVGFETLVVEHITLNVGDNRQIAIQLKVGSAQQTVTVDGSGLTINATDGSVSTIIDRQFVANIPLNGRSFQSLLLLTPGVITNSPQSGSANPGFAGELSVNGQRTESNVYTVDGVSANTGGYIYGYGTSGTSGSLPASTALGTTQSLASVDALQEVRIASSSYSAEFGLSPGGQFSFATRSGTNDLHGTAFDYLRNNYFDANDWFNDQLDQPETALRQNDFGGTLGGPVWIPKLYDGKNRSFFFFSYEGLRLAEPQATTAQYVPSTDTRQTAPPVLQPALNAFPLPTGPEVTVACNNTSYLCPNGAPVGTQVPSGLASFVKSYSLPSRLDSTSVRFDQQISPRFSLFFRFEDTQSQAETRSLSTVSSVSQSSYVSTLGATLLLSNSMVDEFRLNYTSNKGGSASYLDDFGGAIPVDLLQMQGIGPTGQAAFEIVVPGYGSGLSQGPTNQPQHAWNLVDSITISRGRNSFKAGVNYRRTASRLQRATPDVYSYFESSQMITTNSTDFSGVYIYGRSYPEYTNLGLYLQDETRLNDRLAISLGLRWELNPAPGAVSGALPYFAVGDLDAPTSLILSPANTPFYKTTYFNFAPRLGVAYRAHSQPGRETVLRAGGGVFFDSGQQASTQPFGGSPGESVNATYLNVSYPLTPAQVNLPLLNPPLPPYSDAYYFPSRQQLPYTLQWNASLEQALGKSQSLTISYVGSNGRRLLSTQVIGNAPSFPNLYVVRSGTTSNYNALQAKFQRTLARGLQVLASYNWAHSIDFGSQNIRQAGIRGNSDFDLRQNFNAAVTYDVPPITSSNTWMRQILNHWGVDGRFAARTAFPLMFNGNYTTLPNGQSGYSSLDLVPGAPIYIQVAGVAGGRQVNPAAFKLPAENDYGDAPRNFVRGFGLTQVDMAVRRIFPITERVSVQFRAEAFNVPNHPNFGYIDPFYGDQNFGQATEMLNHSLGDLSPLYQQGGPRSMQFALKLVF